MCEPTPARQAAAPCRDPPMNYFCAEEVGELAAMHT